MLAVCAFQYSVMPLLDRPHAPERVLSEFAPELCVISDETWDGFVYLNLLPEHDVIHSIPQIASKCGEAGRGLIVYRLPDYEPPPGYHEVAAWPIWRSNLSTVEIWEGLKNPALLEIPVRYFEPVAESVAEVHQ